MIKLFRLILTLRLYTNTYPKLGTVGNNLQFYSTYDGNLTSVDSLCSHAQCEASVGDIPHAATTNTCGEKDQTQLPSVGHTCDIGCAVSYNGGGVTKANCIFVKHVTSYHGSLYSESVATQLVYDDSTGHQITDRKTIAWRRLRYPPRFPSSRPL